MFVYKNKKQNTRNYSREKIALFDVIVITERKKKLALGVLIFAREHQWPFMLPNMVFVVNSKIIPTMYLVLTM